MIPVLNRLCLDHGKKKRSLHVPLPEFIKSHLGGYFTQGPSDPRNRTMTSQGHPPIPWPIKEFSLEQWITHIKESSSIAAMLDIELDSVAESEFEADPANPIRIRSFASIDRDNEDSMNPDKSPWPCGVPEDQVEDARRFAQDQRAGLMQEIESVIPPVFHFFNLINLLVHAPYFGS